MTFLCLNSKISLTNANLFCSPSCSHLKTSQTGSTAVDSNRPEHHRYPTSISDIDVRRGEVSAQRTGHQETAPFRSFCCCNIRRQSSFFPQTARLSNSSSKLNLNSPDFTVQPRVVEYICCLFLMCRQTGKKPFYVFCVIQPAKGFHINDSEIQDLLFCVKCISCSVGSVEQLTSSAGTRLNKGNVI